MRPQAVVRSWKHDDNEWKLFNVGAEPCLGAGGESSAAVGAETGSAAVDSGE